MKHRGAAGLGHNVIDAPHPFGADAMLFQAGFDFHMGKSFGPGLNMFVDLVVMRLSAAYRRETAMGSPTDILDHANQGLPLPVVCAIAHQSSLPAQR